MRRQSRKPWLAILVAAATAMIAGPGVGQSDRFVIDGTEYRHMGGGVFDPVSAESQRSGHQRIYLGKVEHAHDIATDPDVPLFTDVTLPGVTPPLRDTSGRDYALITLYNIDPPLEDMVSLEPDIDRGIDYRDPSSILKGVYSNYVSAVFTNDEERIPVAGHPIGHFYVKVEVPGYPAILTGMTTTHRADVELVDLTLKRQLGLGGVLLTREPGRLYSSAEAMRELSLRQRELLVVDGRHYRREDGHNVGPTYLVDDGNVVFLRVRLPLQNGKDSIGVFLEYLARGQQSHFGSLLSRPGRGSGAGCSAFAMHWLKSSGVIPFVDEAAMTGVGALDPAARPFWWHFYRELDLPWSLIGCDDRVGLVGQPQAAELTVFDLLFHDQEPAEIRSAIQGVSRLVRENQGAVLGTLFEYGAQTPLRGLVIRSRRKDPTDTGDYRWAQPGDGLAVGFWDNASFSDWIKAQWRRNEAPDGMQLVREGRFLGVEVDAMDAARQSEPFYAVADALNALRQTRAAANDAPSTCRDVFEAYLPD